jgi:hypothetical protein
MSVVKKILIGIVSVLVLMVALNYGVSYYITKKLPSIIQSEKDFPYNISYEDLDISLINGSFTIHNVFLAPKDSTATALKQGAFGKIKTIQVKRFNLWALLREDKIKVKRIILDTPEILLYEKQKKYNVDDDVVKPFKNSITTGSLEIKNGDFKLLDIKQNPVLKAANINIEVDNIKVDSAIAEQNIPVRYTDYKFKCDSLFYRMNAEYNLTAANLKSNDTTVSIDKLRLIPQYSRVQFTRRLKKEKDLFNLSIQKVDVPNADWGYIKNVLYVHSPRVVLNKVNANIYRNKLPADDPSRKKLYSELLRTLDFDLKIDKLLIKNAIIEYEEQIDFTRPAGKVAFSRFYATITNVYSAVNKKKIPPTVADVECLFMKAAPLKVKWTFNVPDKSDAFTIQGDLRNLDTEKIDPLAKPLMNISPTGTIQRLKFTINGNTEGGSGSFAMDYDNLKVDIYKKDGKKKNKFMTAVGNLLVKNDSKDKLKQTDIKVTRLKDKSVFNFLAKCIQEGVKQTVLPKAVSAILPKAGKKKKK